MKGSLVARFDRHEPPRQRLVVCELYDAWSAYRPMNAASTVSQRIDGSWEFQRFLSRVSFLEISNQCKYFFQKKIPSLPTNNLGWYK